MLIQNIARAGLVSRNMMSVAHLGLHHGWPLGPQHFDRLEDVHHALVAHPLQHDTQRDEDSGPPHTSTASGKTTTLKIIKQIQNHQIVANHLKR